MHLSPQLLVPPVYSHNDFVFVVDARERRDFCCVKGLRKIVGRRRMPKTGVPFYIAISRRPCVKGSRKVWLTPRGHIKYRTWVGPIPTLSTIILPFDALVELAALPSGYTEGHWYLGIVY